MDAKARLSCDLVKSVNVNHFEHILKERTKLFANIVKFSSFIGLPRVLIIDVSCRSAVNTYSTPECRNGQEATWVILIQRQHQLEL
jgi:predicted KAP-like P-loop ATPase